MSFGDSLSITIGNCCNLCKEKVGEEVKKFFFFFSSSISSKEGAWQSIIWDHADKDIYGDIDGVHEVDEWRSGVKLILEEWYTPEGD